MVDTTQKTITITLRYSESEYLDASPVAAPRGAGTVLRTPARPGTRTEDHARRTPGDRARDRVREIVGARDEDNRKRGVFVISNIRGERSRRDLTQEQLAEKLGVAESTIRRWEEGITRPSSEMLVTMAGIFGCTTDYLLGLTEERL